MTEKPKPGAAGAASYNPFRPANVFPENVIARLTLASVVPLAMMIAAIILKAPWRDEFWTLYLTDASESFRTFTVDGLHLDPGHPPLYYVLLHAWRMLAPGEFWARAFSIFVLIIGAFSVRHLWRGRPELAWFFLTCIGSYWIIYFATETRSYILLFVLCAISIFVAARALEDQTHTLKWAAIWCLLGMTIGLTHYFGALWVACLGLCVGLSFLRLKSYFRFFAWGITSVVALIPVGLWIASGFQLATTPESVVGDSAGSNALVDGSVQFFRGLIVKLFGSNVALTGAAMIGAFALFRRRNTLDTVLFSAVVLTVVLSFTVQLAWYPILKERSFIVIMPALILLAARAITTIANDNIPANRFLNAAPYLAAITPFLFIPEYFKDRERLGEVAAFIRQHGANCEGAPIVAYFRGGSEQAGLQRWVAERTMRAAVTGSAKPSIVINANSISPPNAPPLNPLCRIRAVAFGLPPGEGSEQKLARAALRRAGVPVSQLVEKQFGKMRQLVFVER